MLLESVYNHFRSHSAVGSITLNKYELYVMNLNNRKKLRQDRLTKNTFIETNGIRLLKHILSLIDFNILDAMSIDIERLSNYFEPQKRVFDELFDPIHTGKTFENMFVSSDNIYETKEYLVPIDSTNRLKQLPLDEDWNFWSSLRPLKILSCDTDEYTIDLRTGYIRYRDIPPFFMVIGIDSILLSFMYYKYRLAHPDINYPMQRFLYEHVFLNLMDDLQDIWLLNLMTDIVKNIAEKNESVSVLKYSKSSDEYRYLGSNLLRVLTELEQQFAKVQNGQVNVYGVLNSLYLSDPSKNLLDIIMDYLKNYYISDMRQYFSYVYLKDWTLITLIIEMYLLNKDSTDSKNVIKRINREIKKYRRSKLWENEKDTLVRDTIEEHINDIYKRIQ